MKINTLIKLIITTLIVFSNHVLSAKPGDLDSSFGENGIVVEYFKDFPNLQLRGIAVQKDMKIVVAGRSRPDKNSNYTILLRRFNHDGTVDQTYGINGISKFDTFSKNDCVYSIALDQNDNSILLKDTKTILKFNNNGNLDSNFSDDGKIELEGCASYRLKTDEAGRILFIGSIAKDADTGMCLIRFHQNGVIDSSFNNKGIATIDFDKNFGGASDLTINNSYYTFCGAVYYESTRDFALTRTNFNGKIDSSFGLNGRKILKFDDVSILEYILVNNNRIYVVGWTLNYHDNKQTIHLLRLNLDGQIDSSFGNNGNVDIRIQENDYPKGMHLQSDGKILISGESEYSNYKFIFLARYNNDGSIDSNFAVKGIIKVRIGDYYNLGGYSSIVSDDYAILAGTVADSNNTGFCLLKYKLSLDIGVIDGFEKEISLIYPNPVKRQATINYELSQDENLKIELFNLSGQKVKTFATNSMRFRGHNSETLDLSDVIIPGTYYITISCSTGAISIKCIKE